MNKTLHLLRKAHALLLMALMTVLMAAAPATAMAENQAYARLADNTLTFYYDENKGQTDADFSLNSGAEDPEWLSKWSTIYKVVFDESYQNYKPTSCYKWFSGMQALKTIEGINYLNTSEVTNMSRMFSNCRCITQLDVTGFDTQNVTDMSYMFFNSALTQLNLSSFNTDKVTNMLGMFSGCNLLEELDLSSFTTTAVEDMSSMFSSCSALTKVNLSSFSTDNVTSMYEMFYNCKSLTELDLSNFSTAKVTDMSEMFSGCSGLTTLDISSFNTANVEDMCYMFLDCSALTSLNLFYFNTAKVTDMQSMFHGCSRLASLDLSSFNTAAVTTMDEMFYGCAALTTIAVSKNFTTAVVEKSSNMFSGCISLKGAVAYEVNKVDATYANYQTGYFTQWVGPYARYAEGTLTFYYGTDKQAGDYAIDDYAEDKYGDMVPAWCQDEEILYSITKVVFDESFATARPTNCSNWFIGMGEMTDIEGMEYLNTTEVTDMHGMFDSCENLAKLDLSHFNTSKVTDMSAMFAYCSSLTQLDLSHFNTENVTNMARMFDYCKSLKDIKLSSFNTAKVTDMHAMFSACTDLTTLDLSNFNTSEVTAMHGMFSSCTDLTKLDLSSFNTSKVTNMYYMFGSCVSLQEVNVSSFNTSQVTSMECMFYYCPQLKQVDVSNFNTENVTNMYRMFSECRSLTKLDLSNFNTAKVTNMWLMFFNCQSLTELDLYGFDTSAVENCNTMFGNNYLLAKIYVGDKFKMTGKSASMFDNCSSLPGYNYQHVDGSMANYTTGYLLKKVGTNGDDRLGAKGETLAIESLQLSDDKPLVLYEECKATTAQYSREMASAWGTLCLPYAVSVTAENNNCSFYELQSVGEQSISLKAIESGTVAAGTPVLVKKNDGQTSISFAVTDADLVTAPVTTEGSNRLVGTFAGELLSADANSYFIAKDKFYRVSDYSAKGVKVNPFRAYILAGDNGNRAAVLNIVADGSTTGIDATDIVDTLNSANAEYYDMSGRRTNGLQKGINIIKTGNKTRKVIVK